MHSAIISPKGVWWKPAHPGEKVWVAIAFAWCMVLFAMMPLWHFKGGQNPAGIRPSFSRFRNVSSWLSSATATRGRCFSTS